MRILKLREEAKRIEARRRALGLDDASFAAARNQGAARTPAKRQLLRTIEEEARRQGRSAPFSETANPSSESGNRSRADVLPEGQAAE
jgi:hypothetical protein